MGNELQRQRESKERSVKAMQAGKLKKSGITITKDGRTIRRGSAYTKFRKDVHFGQRERCIECGRWTSLKAELSSDFSFHLAHIQTRGMGSAFRDDVLGTKKGQVRGGKCGKCHRKEHGQ